MASWRPRPFGGIATESNMLSVKELEYAYSSDAPVIAAVTFDVVPGEILSIVGPSGCGKTTLLKILAGLMRPMKGNVRFQDEIVRGVPDGLAMVFQEYGRSLLPWTTVTGNVELPLRYKRIDKPTRAHLVSDSLKAVGLSGFGQYYPWQLSGGMQQRVAIARALACRPKLLLMDEPFASVDAQTRADLEDLVATVREQFGITIVFITHDIDEAVYLSDRVVVLSRSPATVVDVVTTDLPRPRDQIATKALQQFVAKRSVIAQLIRRQVSAPSHRDLTSR
jgi:NitT/TauT family transport system ATP-binding protein